MEAPFRDFELRRLRKTVLRAVCILFAVLFVIVFAVVNETVSVRSLLPAFPVEERGEGELRVRFLSAGQADCAMIEFPDGELFFIDTGNGSFTGNNRILRYWKGLKKPQCSVILTHAAYDHSGGTEFILKYLGARKVYLPFYGGAPDEEIVSLCNERKVPAEELSRYKVIGDETCYFACISPRSEETGTENDCSAVLYLRYAGVGILFAADISSSRERLLADEYWADGSIFGREGFPVNLEEVDVLKVAHHGSETSSCDDFLSLIKAETAIISCGAGNLYGHPSAGAAERLKRNGSEIYRTDELGDITVTVSADGTYTVGSTREFL